MSTFMECEACGELHDCQPTPIYEPGRGAMLCEPCYYLNVTMGETPRWAER